jgi:hypothetical protein
MSEVWMLGGAQKGRHRADLRHAGPCSVVARWAAAGFLLGAGFWICLGAQELAGNAWPHASPPPSLPEESAGCTALSLDRHGGRTLAVPCLAPRYGLHDTLTAQLATP